tara:strand:+ start:1197 stop:1385 length:189 start_codon:yes stop_codon:yes gene_type:complete
MGQSEPRRTGDRRVLLAGERDRLVVVRHLRLRAAPSIVVVGLALASHLLVARRGVRSTQRDS